MKSPQNRISTDQHGFILITSLLFLMIITLLALSGINSATLQQKMATNSNDKSQSLQAANNTLAYAETLIYNTKCKKKNNCSPPVPKKNQKNQIVCYGINSNNQLTSPPPQSCPVPIIRKGKFIRRSPNSWLNINNWRHWIHNNKAGKYQKVPPNYGPTTHYRIRVVQAANGGGNGNGKGKCKKKDGNGNNKKGGYYFTITSLSGGPNDNAPVVTQSVLYKSTKCNGRRVTWRQIRRGG